MSLETTNRRMFDQAARRRNWNDWAVTVTSQDGRIVSRHEFRNFVQAVAAFEWACLNQDAYTVRLLVFGRVAIRAMQPGQWSRPNGRNRNVDVVIPQDR